MERQNDDQGNDKKRMHVSSPPLLRSKKRPANTRSGRKFRQSQGGIAEDNGKKRRVAEKLKIDEEEKGPEIVNVMSFDNNESEERDVKDDNTNTGVKMGKPKKDADYDNNGATESDNKEKENAKADATEATEVDNKETTLVKKEKLKNRVSPTRADMEKRKAPLQTIWSRLLRIQPPEKVKEMLRQEQAKTVEMGGSRRQVRLDGRFSSFVVGFAGLLSYQFIFGLQKLPTFEKKKKRLVDMCTETELQYVENFITGTLGINIDDKVKKITTLDIYSLTGTHKKMYKSKGTWNAESKGSQEIEGLYEPWVEVLKLLKEDFF